MKLYLLTGLLLASAPAVAQKAYDGPEVATPVKWGQAIVLHSPDSARAAYAKATQAVLAAGFGIDKSDKEALFLSTPAKSLDGSVFLILQLAATPTSTGSDVVIRGVYTWLSATTLMAHVENRQLPVQYIGKGNSATQRAWVAMNQLATTALPGATVGYK